MDKLNIKLKICFIAVLLLLSTGCSLNIDQDSLKIGEVENLQKYENWYSINPGMELKEYRVEKEDVILDKVMIFRIDPDYFRFSIQSNPSSPKTVLEWQQETNAKLVINGGYFDENYNPTGLLIIEGEKFGYETKDGSNGYTGMFLVLDDQPEIRYLPEDNYFRNEKITFGLQSFPTLILPDGRQGNVSKTEKKARRSIIAKDSDGKILIIVTKGNYFSLHDIMNYLLDLDIEIDVALNLDGGPSTGISVSIDDFNYNVESSNIPNVIIVKSK